jgi:hypothetical protein
VQKHVSPLVAGGWLTPETAFATNNTWLVNPRAHLEFAERTEAERTRREQVRQIIAEETGETK